MQYCKQVQLVFAAGGLIAALLLLSGAAYCHPMHAPASNPLKNPSFETPNLAANMPPHFGRHALADLPYYVYPYYTGHGSATVHSWTYGTDTGIINTTAGYNPWYGDTSPTGFLGLQYDFVQGNGALSQSFAVASSGTYDLNWLDAGRPVINGSDGNQTYNVALNGTTLGSYSTVSGQNFTPEKLQLQLNAGTYVIQFIGTTTTGDHTAFIDNVKILLAH